MKSIFFYFFLIISVSGCQKYRNEVLIIGEIVQIPVEFVGFKVSEINNISVYRISKLNPTAIDTFQMWEILWAKDARTFNEILTDNAPDSLQKAFGFYKSYLDNSNLIIEWETGRDTLSDFQIKKSKGSSDECHQGDPNIKIDHFSFVHKGKTIGKRESIQIKR